MTEIPKFDPRTAVADIRGYAMYDHHGEPWIVHTYTVRVSDGKGTKRPEKRVEHLRLDSEEGWGDTATARVVLQELRKQWAEWREWNHAMRDEATRG